MDGNEKGPIHLEAGLKEVLGKLKIFRPII